MTDDPVLNQLIVTVQKQDERIQKQDERIQKQDDRINAYIEREEVGTAAMMKVLLSINSHIESLSIDEHSEHHDFIKSKIDRENDASLFWREQRSKLATAGILGATSILLGAGWFLIKFWIANGVKS